MIPRVTWSSQGLGLTYPIPDLKRACSMGPKGSRAVHGLFGMQKAGREGPEEAAEGKGRSQDAASSGAVCHRLSGTWLGPGLESVEREGASAVAAAAAAIAQMEEEVESWRQGGTGSGTREHVPHREAWH